MVCPLLFGGGDVCVGDVEPFIAGVVVVVVYGPTSEISSLTVLDVAVALAERGPCEQDGGEWVICKNV